MPPQNDGKPGNVIFGCPPGYFTAWRIEPNRYHAAWNPLSAITAFDKDKNPISVTKTIDPEKNYTYIDYTSGDDYILFQAEESTTNPADQLNSLLALFSDLEIENLAEAQTIYNGRSYTGCLFVYDNSTYLEVFNEFSRNFSTRVIFTHEGKIRLKVLRWGGEQPERLPPYVIKDFTQNRETKYLKGQYIRMYQYNVDQKSFAMTPVIASSDMSQDVAELKQKYITLDVVSLDAAAREAFLRKEPL
ncbi:MAG: hypothetical protein GTN82_02195, partial [Candidatus Aminicenantes bacterium]|nr:hypothetical protein [Candidatus Aminicenantes bacterium]